VKSWLDCVSGLYVTAPSSQAHVFYLSTTMSVKHREKLWCCKHASVFFWSNHIHVWCQHL